MRALLDTKPLDASESQFYYLVLACFIVELSSSFEATPRLNLTFVIMSFVWIFLMIQTDSLYKNYSESGQTLSAKLQTFQL